MNYIEGLLTNCSKSIVTLHYDAKGMHRVRTYYISNIEDFCNVELSLSTSIFVIPYKTFAMSCEVPKEKWDLLSVKDYINEDVLNYCEGSLKDIMES